MFNGIYAVASQTFLAFLMLKNFVLIVILCLCLQPVPIAAESLWHAQGAYLFSDACNLKIGDSITVIISEASSAYQKAGTKLDNESELSVGPGTGFLEFGDIAGANQVKESDAFSGTGTTERSGRLTGTLTVKIVEILDNGDYAVSGNKQILINSEEQKISISGSIRPADIDANNTVLSSKIANATIKFLGQGPIGDSQEPGLITKLFAWIF